jgi:cytochrome c oxidase cbb3-type subunit IV
MPTAYETARHLADSWGLLYLVGVFCLILIYSLRPGQKEKFTAAAQLPLREEGENTHEP